MKKSMKKQNHSMTLHKMKVGIKQQWHIPKQQPEVELAVLYGVI